MISALRHRYASIAAFTLVVVMIQLLAGAAGKSFYLTQLTMSGYYSLLIVGLCLMMGYAGQISLGHAGFFAIGGYVSAVLTTFDFTPFKDKAIISLSSSLGLMVSRTGLYGDSLLNFKPWAACILAIILAAVVAYIIGGPVLKLKGHYLAMATLGFGTIIYRIAIGTQFLGAADGITEVPSFGLLAGLEVSGKTSLRVSNYYISWGLVIVGMTLLLNLLDSRAGRALKAIHGAEDASSAVGVDTARYKLQCFVLSAVFAAIAGVFLTHFNGGIGPSEASIMKSVRYVAIVAIGGMANLWGALIMGLVLNFLSLRGYFGTFDDAVFGGILILIMLFAPEGIVGRHVIRDIKTLFFSRKIDKDGEGQ